MYCTNCGKQLPDDTKFCTGCGVPQSPATQTSANSGRNTAPSREKKRKPILPILLGTLLLILLAGAGVLLYTMFGSQTVYLLTEQESKNQAAGSIFSIPI